MIGSGIQGAIYKALLGIVDDRVYDDPPENAVFPYITIGDEQVIDDGTTCSVGWETYSDVHIWSRPGTGSKKEVKDLSRSVVAAVLAITSVDGQRLMDVKLESASASRDGDGKTEHASLTFRFLTQED